MPDCAPLRNHSFYMYTGWDAAAQISFFDRVLIAGDVVVLSFYFSHYNKKPFQTQTVSWVREMDALLQSRGAAIMLFGDVPRKTEYDESPTESGPRCVPTTSRPDVPAACYMSKDEV